MLENILKMNIIKKVNKHWGHELWIADGVQQPYALKHISFKAGHRTSLQVHKYKFETNYVLKGTGKLYISKQPFDIDVFLKIGMTEKQIIEYESTLDVIELVEKISFNVIPGHVHRVVAITDLEFIEVSTSELHDVIRLQDDLGRTHGKIESEHE